MGVITQPSSISRQSPPIRLISADMAAKRSVSWPRMCAMPVIRLGPSAKTASAATTWANSPPIERSMSIPRITPVPLKVSPRSSRTTSAPIFCRIQTNSFPTWVVTAGQSGMVTEPPATMAAAKNGPALDRSGSICFMPPATGPGSTRQTVGSGWLTATPRSRRHCKVISMCGKLGSCSPT